jgi:hypothetical protein
VGAIRPTGAEVAEDDITTQQDTNDVTEANEDVFASRPASSKQTKTRPRPKPRYNATPPSRDSSEDPSVRNKTSPALNVTPDPKLSSSNRKRRRENDGEVEENDDHDTDHIDDDGTNDDGGGATTDDEDEAAAISAMMERQRRAAHDKPSSQASQAHSVADFKSTRKRARH